MPKGLTKREVNREIEEGSEEYEKEKRVGRMGERLCPYLDAPSFEECKTEEQTRLLKKVHRFANEAAKDYYDTMVEAIDTWRYPDGRPIPNKIKEFLQRHEERYLYPEFTFKFGEDANLLGAHLGIPGFPRSEPLPPNQGILAFQLPGALAARWWKSKERVKEGLRTHGYAGEWAELEEGLSPKAIAWGDIYDQTVWSIRAMRDRWDADGELYFERLEPYFTHDPNTHYYAWLVNIRG